MIKKQTGSRKNRMNIPDRIRRVLSRSRMGEILVVKKCLSPAQLRRALKIQSESPRKLGQILLTEKMITRRQLAFALGRQYTLRALAALVFFFGSFSVSGKKADAEMIKDIPAQIRVVSAKAGAYFPKPSAYPALLGSAEKRSANLKAFTKWTGMFRRFERELQDPHAKEPIQRLQASLKPMQNLSLKHMAERVNALMNAQRYIGDSKNWGKSDYWATPVEFLQRGGDCEDFAIAKYTALRALGVPEERLRVAIVHDNLKNIPHAVLIVYTEEGAYLLDNQIKRLVDAESAGRYKPIFSINRQAWWLHTAPSATRLASVQ